MQMNWRTLPEIALDRHITLDEARALVEDTNCAKVFKTDGTLYLI